MEAMNMNQVTSAALPAIETLDPTNVVIRYDRDSDTLMVHFYGLGIPGFSVPNEDGWYVRWDRDASRPIGLQLEGFLARAVREEPSLLDALALADLRDITAEEVAEIRRKAGLAAHPSERFGLADLLPRLWRFMAGTPTKSSPSPRP